jgi:beta-aspartyl-peptidase (threonine type)
MTVLRMTALCIFVLLGMAGCTAENTVTAVGPDAQPSWAIALHGGAGGIPGDQTGKVQQQYLRSLERALTLGVSVLEDGGSSLDAVEQVIRDLEDDPLFNAGKGAVYNHEGRHELDASIMDGATLACGGVASVSTVKHPITVARAVMEQTRHVLLSGAGADRFATELGVDLVDQDYFHTPRRYEQLQRALDRERAADDKGTAGVVALDMHGNLAAGTSTGGITNKMFGRVGDSPLIGAGTYAKNGTCAVSATGIGEEFIRHGVAYSISALMAYGGMSLEQAATRMIDDTLRPGDGGIIAVGQDGRIVMRFNTEGMFRGAADSNGRFEVAIGRAVTPP